MRHPSNTTTSQWDDDLFLDTYDFNCNESFWYRYYLLDSNDMDTEWAASCSKEYYCTGSTIKDILQKYWGAKSGDIKNGYKSITINKEQISYEDLTRPITIDADGLYINYSKKTLVIHNFPCDKNSSTSH